MVCSQNRRCHRSYSALALRVIGTPAATRDRVKKLLIRRHRPEKSASSTGRGTNRVQMVGENDYRIDCERTFAPRYPECGTQGSNVFDEGRRIPIGKRQCEEECSARNEVTSVTDHGPVYRGFRLPPAGLPRVVPDCAITRLCRVICPSGLQVALLAPRGAPACRRNARSRQGPRIAALGALSARPMPSSGLL